MLLLGVVQAQAAGDVSFGSYDLLATEILTGSQASVTFSSLGTLAAGYQHLQIRALSSTSRTPGGDSLMMQFNGVTTTSYSRHNLRGTGSSVSSSANASQSSMYVGDTPSSDNVNFFGGHVIDILDPFETTKNTTFRALSGAANVGFNDIRLSSGAYFATSAITSITLFANVGPNLNTGSRFSLYGIRAV
jgi:hypothetical protein